MAAAAPAAPGSGPSDADLAAALVDLLAGADLATSTPRQLRALLTAKFATDLEPRKAFIKSQASGQSTYTAARCAATPLQSFVGLNLCLCARARLTSSSATRPTKQTGTLVGGVCRVPVRRPQLTRVPIARSW